MLQGGGTKGAKGVLPRPVSCEVSQKLCQASLDHTGRNLIGLSVHPHHDHSFLRCLLGRRHVDHLSSRRGSGKAHHRRSRCQLHHRVDACEHWACHRRVHPSPSQGFAGISGAGKHGGGALRLRGLQGGFHDLHPAVDALDQIREVLDLGARVVGLEDALLDLVLKLPHLAQDLCDPWRVRGGSRVSQLFTQSSKRLWQLAVERVLD